MMPLVVQFLPTTYVASRATDYNNGSLREERSIWATDTSTSNRQKTMY